jgi:hypothetical protein
MNKKVLGIAVVLIAVTMLVIPLMGTAEACGHGKKWGKQKTVDVYTRTPGVNPPTEVILEEIPGVEKIICNGKLTISSGTSRTVAYGSESDDRGPLGYGTKYVKTIISITHRSGEMVTTPLGEETMYGHGFGIYKVKFVIEDGPYGAGTLEATERFEWEWDLSDPNPLNKYEGWSSYTLKHGTGDFAGVTVDLETYFNVILGFYHTKTTVIY